MAYAQRTRSRYAAAEDAYTCIRVKVVTREKMHRGDTSIADARIKRMVAYQNRNDRDASERFACIHITYTHFRGYKRGIVHLPECRYYVIARISLARRGINRRRRHPRGERRHGVGRREDLKGDERFERSRDSLRPTQRPYEARDARSLHVRAHPSGADSNGAERRPRAAEDGRGRPRGAERGRARALGGTAGLRSGPTRRDASGETRRPATWSDRAPSPSRAPSCPYVSMVLRPVRASHRSRGVPRYPRTPSPVSDPSSRKRGVLHSGAEPRIPGERTRTHVRTRRLTHC